MGWRVGGILSLFAAYFGAAAAVRTFRGEEESGRFELVAAGAITRAAAFASRGAAAVITLAVLWLGGLIGLLAGGLPAAGSAFLALAIISAAAVYLGVGALTSQLAATRRGALELAGLVLAVDFVLRVVADTTGVQRLHWATPLGWAEELRPFADPRPAVLLLPLSLTALLLVASHRLESRRDVGVSLFPPRDVSVARLRLLGSPTLLALRAERVSLAVWVAATGGFALVLGTVSKSVASAGVSASVAEQLQKLGQVQITTASGYIGLTFLFFVLAVSLFCCSQLAAARSEEAAGRLETLFALPQGRIRWLGGRLALAAGGATLIALAAGLGSAIGATAVGADVSFTRLLEAGLNCLPAAALFLGIATLLVAAAPRLGVGAAYGLVSVAFVWELVGTLLGAPSWLVDASPFHHVGLVPAQPFRATAAAVMIAVGLVAAGAGIALFRRRDLVTA